MAIWLDPSMEVRHTEEGDLSFVKTWLLQKGMEACFPMLGEKEVGNAAKHWVDFYKWNCSLTILNKKVPVGIATLYLLPYKRLSHQCEFGILLDTQLHRKGLGSRLMHEFIIMAKQSFKIELLHLQVAEGNERAQSFFRSQGFNEFARQDMWFKEKDGSYRARIFMQREL